MSDLISRHAAYDTLTGYYHHTTENQHKALREALERVPSAQPETHEERTETHACDLISRQAAIRWVKTECNPYGKPTLDFESGKKVIEHLKQMPSAQPEPCENVVSREDVQSIAERSDWFESSDSFNDFLLALYALPSAQPDLSEYSDKLWRNAYERGRTEAQAEIVRCKDCRYWDAHDKRCVYLNHGFAPNMWCCHGRRADE